MIPFLLAIGLVLTPAGSLPILGKVSLAVPEPSDMIYDEANSRLIVVSDNGGIYALDLTGKILAKSKFTGSDLEAVTLTGDSILVVDETFRLIHVLDSELNHLTTASFQYQGGRNKGVESVASSWNDGKLILITEKDPTWIMTMNSDRTIVSKQELSLCSDVSSARFHEESLYVMCDEDREIIQVDPFTYKELNRFRIPVHNPEGFDFVNGELWVVSDDRQMLYRLELPQ